MSKVPGPTQTDPFSEAVPARTPGPLGVRDAADPNVGAHPGDTPGSLGVNDGAACHATGFGTSAGPAMRMLTNLMLAAVPLGKASPHHAGSHLLYSHAPAADAKKRIDDEITNSGITISKTSAEYWSAYISRSSGNNVVVGSTKRYQFFYLPGGAEGFLQFRFQERNASAVFYDYNFDWARVNDALIIFDPAGTKLVAALQLVYPLGNRYTNGEFREWSEGHLPVFVYYNKNFANDYYRAISVMSLHKINYSAHRWQEKHPGHKLPKEMAPVSKQKQGAWVDIHDVSKGTLGCIGVESESVAAFDAAYAELDTYAKQIKDQPRDEAEFNYQDEHGNTEERIFPGHVPVGQLTVLPAPK